MSLRLPWVSSLSPHVEPGYRRMVGAVLLITVPPNQKWPTSGQGGYITPAAWGVPTASEWRVESEVARKWARWLHNPCRLGGPHRFRAGGRIRSGPQVLRNPCFLGDPQKGGIDMAHVGLAQKGL